MLTLEVGDAVALEGGLQPRHAARLRSFCSERGYRSRKLVIVIRATDPDRLPWHGRGGGTTPWGDGDSGPQGWVVVDATLYYADYDLQGVFVEAGERRYEPLFTGRDLRFGDRATGAPRLDEFLHELNEYVCGRDAPAMFLGRAQDEYVVLDAPHPEPQRDARYLVFEPDGSMHLIQGNQRLALHLAGRGMRWRTHHA
jgi:hypothetical protein